MGQVDTSGGSSKKEPIQNGGKLVSKGKGTCFSDLLFWTDTYGATLERIWKRVPNSLGQLIACLAMFIMGLTVRGEWLLFAVYFVKYLQSGGDGNYVQETEEMIDSVHSWFMVRFEGYFQLLIYATLISYLTYFGIGGFLHTPVFIFGQWYYYVNRRDSAHEWKCQPNNWLSPELERHEILLGSISLVFGSAISAALATYVMNGGTATKVYFQAGEYGYIWLILQVPLVFIYQDYVTYWTHRLYHTPWLYKNFHKLHHTYKQPTAFSVTAIHPIEFMQVQFTIIMPIFVVPMYWVNVVLIYSYVYYHGIIDHSGINFKRYWWQPWQPDCIFHDNHHQYFHVNFGFNIELWDKLHGTARRKDRIYREDIFYGFGKKLEEASQDEIKQDMEERENENPKAYSHNKHEFKLD